MRIVLQNDVMQCGAASLCMICRHFGSKVSLDFVDNLCKATKEGVSMLAISEAAEELKFETATVRLTIEELCQAPLPAILHWGQNHFVVIEKINKNGNKFYILDPAKGKRVCNKEELKQYWTIGAPFGEDKGIAMLFEPTKEFKESIIYKQENKVSYNILFKYFFKYRKYFLHILGGLLIAGILQLIMPFLTQSIVDVGIKHQNIDFIWLVLLGEFMIVLGRTATDFVRRRIVLHISMRINVSLVSDFFIKLLRLPMSFFDTKLLGDLLQRMSDYSRIQDFLTTQVLGIMFTVFSFSVLAFVLLIYNSLLFVVFVGFSLFYGLWILVFLKKRKILDYCLFEQQAINQNKTYQFLKNIQEIKLQNCEVRRRYEWEDCQADLFNIRMRTLKLQQTQEAGSIFINELKNIIITVIAAGAVVRGQMTLGEMLAVQYIIGELNSPVEQIMNFIYALQDIRISLERINSIYNRKNEDNEDDKQIEQTLTPNDLCFSNVKFKYDKHANNFTIDGVSVLIPEGKVTAIIGASGSGKTTLIKLLLGYYSVNSGSLTISNRDINSINKKSWRNKCGVVMQDGVIFSDSIARNIAISDVEIDNERLIQAAKVANIHDFIMSLPLKYDTLIGMDGNGLSQGQKQRILIARAVYKDPEYIFLDEATNSLDAANEREIVDNLSSFYRGKTVVIVAHRLSTVKNADQIVVMQSGKIVETGTHSELIKLNGVYFNLIKNQLELGV
jgi:ATP-binding cassette subfamily B protein